jgi:hypothetical protein
MMNRTLTVLVPSRGRPETVAQMVEAFANTAAVGDVTTLAFVVDRDDPAAQEYGKAVDDLTDGWLTLEVVDGGTMVKALNEAAQREVTGRGWRQPPYAVGFMGDDHRPRTYGWDSLYLEALRTLDARPGPFPGAAGVAMVYGDDGFQGPNIPTQIAMTAETVRRLGWMAPDAFRHLFVDNVWLSLGQAVQRIMYLPGVLDDHLHPGTGKVPWTPGHERVNASEVWEHDQAAFEAWKRGDGPDDMKAAVDRLLGQEG